MTAQGAVTRSIKRVGNQMSIASKESKYRLFVGVDISAASAAVAWIQPGAKVTRSFTIEQTPQGFALLRQKILATGNIASEVLIVMEATGCYWTDGVTAKLQSRLNQSHST